MCGIAGIYNFNAKTIEPMILKGMIEKIQHRGPDDQGLEVNGQMGLAHARLGIIDIRGGRQPMADESKNLWIIFNGAIFNYRALREELTGKGHRFVTDSDTEVILRLYQEEGEDCVKYLNGQWSFAIWDKRRQKLFLSRDRLGICPLFYTIIDQSFIFASEIKAIFAHPKVGREIDLPALSQIFTFWSTLPEKTIFKNILELPAGHSLSIEHGKVSLNRYWSLDFTPDSESLNEQEYGDRLRELLQEAVRLRLVSDVPLGAYLSGGLDSTIIATLMKKETNRPLKTFSIVFDDPEFDESVFQEKVSSFLESDHSENRNSSWDIVRSFPDVVWHAEKPVLRTAPAPFYLLSEFIRTQGYKVILTGEGSDEILGGYDIYKEAKIRRFWGVFPDSKIRPLLLRRLYPYQKNLQAQSDDYLKSFFGLRPGDWESPFFSHLPRWRMTSGLKRFFSEGVKSELKDYDPYSDLNTLLPPEYFQWDSFSQSQYLETALLLPGYILSSQGDRMAMSHSVECRHPFLDHRVVEYCAKIPPRLKMKVLNEKYILKKSMEKLIPESVRRRFKQPYRAPEAGSFIEENKRFRHEYVQDLLSEEKIDEHGIFNPNAVSKLVKKVKLGNSLSVRDNMAFVGILSTELLMKQFVEKFERISSYSYH